MSGLAFKRFLSTNSTKINEVFIVSHARTPMGAFQGNALILRRSIEVFIVSHELRHQPSWELFQELFGLSNWIGYIDSL